MQKLTANQQRRIDELTEYQRVVDHVRSLVNELDSSRAQRQVVIDNICGAIARELSQLRQRTMTNPVGTLGDTAGTLAVLAARGGSGFAFKVRGLLEGVNSMNIFLDAAMRSAMQPERAKDPSGLA